jgi:hypothetical protein
VKIVASVGIEVTHVKDANTPNNLPRSSGNLLPGVVGLGRRKPGQLSAAKREGCRDEDRAESVEAVPEGLVRRVPAHKSIRSACVLSILVAIEIYQYLAPI